MLGSEIRRYKKKKKKTKREMPELAWRTQKGLMGQEAFEMRL